jgi:hypothetical protein
MKNIELDYIPNTVDMELPEGEECHGEHGVVLYKDKVIYHANMYNEYIDISDSYSIRRQIAKKLKVKPESLEFIETVPNQKMTKVIQSYLKKHS